MENLSAILDAVGKEKKIDKAVLVEALEQAILTAAKRTFGMAREMEAKFNLETGAVDLSLIIAVVEDDEILGREITVEQAATAGLAAELGDELVFRIYYRAEDSALGAKQDADFGDVIDLKQAHKQFGRIAAQTAKQVIMQRVRDAERDNVFAEFKDRKGEIVIGTVRRFERGAIVVELGLAEGIMPVREQVPRESYRVGDNVRCLLVDIDRTARGPQLIVSRAHKGFLEKLFEQQVPEIVEKIVRIESSAREPGARSKIAVSSRDGDVDPVGACVGMKGARVQAVVQEMRGEKIDIVPYDPDPARFVCNAIAPAEVSRVIIDAEGHRMELVVPDEKLSLAIGRKGQNVRLASQLTGWRIDIHSESKIQDLERRAREQIAAIPGMTLDVADELFRLGWRSVGDVAVAVPEELAQVHGIGGVAGAHRIIEAAQNVFEASKVQSDDNVKEAERRSQMSGPQQLLEIPGVDEEVLGILAEANVRSPQDLVAKPIDEMAAATGIDMGDLAKLRQRAVNWISETGEQA
ncbi:MAG: transcription termination/antitermination protein NusA [Myxococcales bacterium]|nr:transcription termination/antitermination protein NusA [Myxococcales bacterium]